MIAARAARGVVPEANCDVATLVEGIDVYAAL
jgi:hypothetical protein